MPQDDLPDGYSVPDLPGPDGYSLPDLPAQAVQQAPAPASVPQAEAAGDGRFQMKPLGEHYQEGEKNNAAQTVSMGGQAVEVHEKDWLRQMSDAQRTSQGKKPMTDAQWASVAATTQYMNDAQRAEHLVGFEPSADATGAQNAKLGGDSLQQGRDHIFVMDGQGQVFAKEAQAALSQKDDTGRGVHVHHSSFLAGEDVAGAGEMRVDNEGFLKEVTDRSGHYKPGEEQTAQTLEELENKGVNLNNVKFTMDRGEDKTTGMAKEYQQGGEQVFKARHNVADEIKERGKSVREALDQDANRRATRVSKAQGYLEDGMDYQKISEGAQAHAAKDALALEGKAGEALAEQLQEQKEALGIGQGLNEGGQSTREALGNSLEYGQSPPQARQSLGVR